jgi:Holliday junction resolvase RusA-like endonuclease
MNKIEIPMPPFGKARPRVTLRGTYMPHAYEEKRAQLRLLYMAAGGEVDMEYAVHLDVHFFFRMPKSWSKKKKEQMYYERCQKTPDLDNLVGAVMDALIEKDQNVVSISSSKVWGFEDKIVIRIGEAT